MIKNYINKKIFFSIFFICTFSSYTHADMHDDDNMNSSSRGFFAIYPSIIISSVPNDSPDFLSSFYLAYGRGLSKREYVGSLEIGWAATFQAVASSPFQNVAGFQLKYEYDFLNKNDLWSLGVDTSALIGVSLMNYKKNEDALLPPLIISTNKGDAIFALTIVNELGVFAGRSISKSVSALIRLGATYRTANDINPYFGFGIRYYLKN